MSHITLLLPDLEMGGAQRVMLFLAREFVAHGHHVDLVLLSSSGPLLNDIPKTVNTVDLAVPNFGLGQLGFLISSVFYLSIWMRKKKPDVILSTITGANLVALLAQKNVSSPRIVIREAVTLKNINNTLRLRAMRWLYPKADAVISLTNVMAEELNSKIGVSRTNIHCISNPVDTEFIHQQAKIPISQRWLNNKEFKVIISVGRLIIQKDYETLLRAFALLPRKLSAYLIIIGEGDEKSKLEKLSVELEIDDITLFAGFDSNPWRWMAQADLFVLSSRWEGQPNALLEALALGLPAVITNYDSSAVDIQGKSSVSVVDIGDEKMLAKKIEQHLLSKKTTCIQEISNNNNNIIKSYLHALGARDKQ